jgi:hypothetical protein
MEAIVTSGGNFDTQREMEERGERMKDMHEVNDLPKDYWIDMLPDVPKDRDECECGQPVYIFMRWSRIRMGEDKFKRFVEDLTSGFDVKVEMNKLGHYVIKGDGVVGYAEKKYVDYKISMSAVKWLENKCKESRESRDAVTEIIDYIYGVHVDCENLEKYVEEEREFEITMGAIVNASSSDTKLVEVITSHMGRPDLIRPY